MINILHNNKIHKLIVLIIKTNRLWADYTQETD